MKEDGACGEEDVYFYFGWCWIWSKILHEGDPCSIPGSVRAHGGKKGNPLQYSCLENSMDRGAWQSTVHGVTKSWTWLKRLILSLPGGSVGKEFICSAGDAGDMGMILGRDDPWKKAWQPTPVFLPGESHGQKDPGRLQSTRLQRVGHDWNDCWCQCLTHTCLS